MGIDVGTVRGSVPSAENAIEILRYELERVQLLAQRLQQRIDGQPPILTLEEIQDALSPTGSHPLATAALLNTTPAETSPPPLPPPDDGIPDYLTIVQNAATTLGITGASTDEQVFRFAQTVAQDINLSGLNPSGIVCGLTLAPPAGANVFTCAGITYRYARVTFSNDHTFDILIDADPGGARTPQWSDNGITPGLYSVATDPTSPC